MNIPEINEHMSCYNYEHSKLTIETFTLSREEKATFKSIYNKVICIRSENDTEMIFLPAGRVHNYLALDTSEVTIFRLLAPISLCMGYSVEKLYEEGSAKFDTPPSEKDNVPYKLPILPSIEHLLEGVKLGLTDNMKCRYWFELKIRELFILLRTYYSKQDLYYFLYPALSGDTQFFNDILKHWRTHPSVEELSEVMHMSTRQLSTRFKSVFGITIGKWIIREKAKIIHHEITCTTKLFNQIAEENGFLTKSIFTHFCKREFGCTPSELRRKNK